MFHLKSMWKMHVIRKENKTFDEQNSPHVNKPHSNNLVADCVHVCAMLCLRICLHLSVECVLLIEYFISFVCVYVQKINKVSTKKA